MSISLRYKQVYVCGPEHPYVNVLEHFGGVWWYSILFKRSSSWNGRDMLILRSYSYVGVANALYQNDGAADGGVAGRVVMVKKEMSHYQAEDAEYMVDEYEMEDVDDDMDDELRGRDNGGSDSNVDEYDAMNNKLTDTTISQAKRGTCKDKQGIP
ncbi:hypothetical protein POM88_009087 [Heracleum sosnowskyi]|uniref:Uncharacterized protein n=1 Tax=Heracleum sosnowskyi TaxID=360622 RepID=A0AAD8J993_9APIA|nr:hypothetical protein POM88_009087 [Heracleum sosnowskyi]